MTTEQNLYEAICDELELRFQAIRPLYGSSGRYRTPTIGAALESSQPGNVVLDDDLGNRLMRLRAEALWSEQTPAVIEALIGDVSGELSRYEILYEVKRAA